MLAMTSQGSTSAASARDCAGARAFATQNVGGVTYTLHGHEVTSPDDADLFALALPAPFGALLMRQPVFWSWDALGAPKDADIGAMLEHLASADKVQSNPIIIRDVLSTAPGATESVRDDDDDDELSEDLSDSETDDDEHSADLSGAEDDVISLLYAPAVLEE